MAQFRDKVSPFNSAGLTIIYFVLRLTFKVALPVCKTTQLCKEKPLLVHLSHIYYELILVR